MKKTSIQRWISIFLLVLAVILGIVLHIRRTNFIWYWIFGLGFGFVLQHFRICFVSATSEPFITNSTEKFRALLIGILVSSLGITAIKYLADGTYDMLGVSAISLPLVLGAFLFGIGMIFAGCCSSGMYIRFAEGYIIHFVTFICVIAGYLIANYDYSRIWAPHVAKAPVIFLPHKLGWIGGVATHLMIILLLYWVARRRERNISASDSTLYLKGSILIGIFNILHYIVFDSGWSITGAFHIFIDNNSVTVAHNIRNLGLLMGALISVLLCANFKFKKIRSAKQVIFTIVGGLLMGYGARIAGGCNINAFFNATASLSLSGWVFMIFLFAGTYVGMKIMYILM